MNENIEALKAFVYSLPKPPAEVLTSIVVLESELNMAIDRHQYALKTIARLMEQCAQVRRELREEKIKLAEAQQ